MGAGGFRGALRIAAAVFAIALAALAALAATAWIAGDPGEIGLGYEGFD